LQAASKLALLCHTTAYAQSRFACPKPYLIRYSYKLFEQLRILKTAADFEHHLSVPTPSAASPALSQQAAAASAHHHHHHQIT
jgi:hypothetical protein